MLRLYLERRKRLGGEVLEVLRDNGIASPNDSCRQHVPVIWVGKFERRNKALVTRNQTVADARVHEIARALERTRGPGGVHCAAVLRSILDECRSSTWP